MFSIHQSHSARQKILAEVYNLGLRTVNRGTVNRGTIKRGQLIAGQLIAWTHNRSDN